MMNKLTQLLTDPDTFKPDGSRNMVDPALWFSATQFPELFSEFQAAIRSDLPSFESCAVKPYLTDNENGIMTQCYAIDIDPSETPCVSGQNNFPRPGMSWEFRSLRPCSPRPRNLQPQRIKPSSTAGEGFNNGIFNVTLLLGSMRRTCSMCWRSLAIGTR